MLFDLSFVFLQVFWCMFKWFAKILSSLAVSIILMHAMVPHHHHDCCGGRGFVFENEVACHCNGDYMCGNDCCDHEGSNHPLNRCRLQDLLSKLVISQKSDELLSVLKCVPVLDLFVLNCPSQEQIGNIISIQVSFWIDADGGGLPRGVVSSYNPFRAPPCC